MAAPTVATTNNGGVATSNNPTINLPASIASGDLLLIFFACDSTAIITAGPSGFTQLKKVHSGSGTQLDLYVYYKTATGSEGASTSLTLNTPTHSAHVTYRVTGWTGTPEASTGVTGSGITAANPDAITPSTGTKDYLIIALGSLYPDSSSFTNYSYANNNVEGHVASSDKVRASTTTVTASTEDPPAYSLNVGADVAAVTISVQGAPSGLFTKNTIVRQAINRASTY